MALIRIDWNPSRAKVRQFGLLLGTFALMLAGYWAWRGHGARAYAILGAGLGLGTISAAAPGGAGLWVYKGWMGVSFAVGSVVSPLIIGLLYYGMVTPVALLMRLFGRDALKLKRPAGETYWAELKVPQDKAFLERLF